MHNGGMGPMSSPPPTRIKTSSSPTPPPPIPTGFPPIPSAQSAQQSNLYNLDTATMSSGNPQSSPSSHQHHQAPPTYTSTLGSTLPQVRPCLNFFPSAFLVNESLTCLEGKSMLYNIALLFLAATPFSKSWTPQGIFRLTQSC